MSDIPDQRPYYEPETRTHYVELPRLAFDAARQGLGMLDITLLADGVEQGNWIWIECESDAVLLSVTGIAAITKPAPEAEATA